MFQFEIDSHTGETRTEILLYEKGGVMKYVKAPAINKVDLLDLWKKDLVTKWKRVKYFITNCSTSCMSVLLSATGFGISLLHYSFRSYKMWCSTLSHISTFVTPWPLRRRRFPAEITARWRYRPPIKNMTAHYNSQFCVSVYCCFLQEAQKRLWMCLNGAVFEESETTISKQWCQIKFLF